MHRSRYYFGSLYVSAFLLLVYIPLDSEGGLSHLRLVCRPETFFTTCVNQKIDLSSPLPILKTQFLRLGLHSFVADPTPSLQSTVLATASNLTWSYVTVINASEFSKAAAAVHMNATKPIIWPLATISLGSYSYIPFSVGDTVVSVSAVIQTNSKLTNNSAIFISTLSSPSAGDTTSIMLLMMHILLCVASVGVFVALLLKGLGLENVATWPRGIAANLAEQCIAFIALLFLVLILSPGRMYLSVAQLWAKDTTVSYSFLFLIKWSESASGIGLIFCLYLLVDGLKYTPDTSVVRRGVYTNAMKRLNDQSDQASGKEYTNNLYLWRSEEEHLNSNTVPSTHWYMPPRNYGKEESGLLYVDRSVRSDDGSVANTIGKSFTESVQNRFFTSPAFEKGGNRSMHHPLSPPYTAEFLSKAIGALLLSWTVLAAHLYILIFPDQITAHHQTTRSVGSVASVAVYIAWSVSVTQAFRSSGHVLKSISHMKSRLRQIIYRVLYSQVFRCLVSLVLSICIIFLQDYEDIKRQVSVVSSIFSLLNSMQQWRIISQSFSFFFGQWLIDGVGTCLTTFISVLTLSVVVTLMPIALTHHSSSVNSNHGTSSYSFLDSVGPDSNPSRLGSVSGPLSGEHYAKERMYEQYLGASHTYLPLERMRPPRSKQLASVIVSRLGSHSSVGDTTHAAAQELFCLETACKLMEVAYQTYFEYDDPKDLRPDFALVNTDSNYEVGSDARRNSSEVASFTGPRIDLRSQGYELHTAFQSSATATFGFVGLSGGGVVVAFRGSVLANFMTDANVWQTELPDLRIGRDMLRALVGLACEPEYPVARNCAATGYLNPFSDESDETEREREEGRKGPHPNQSQDGWTEKSADDSEKRGYSMHSDDSSASESGSNREVDSDSLVRKLISSIPVIKHTLPRIHKGFWEAYSSVRNPFLGILVRSLVDCLKRRREAASHHWRVLDISNTLAHSSVLRTRIDDSFSEESEIRIRFCGHSLGASLSVLAAADVAVNMEAIWRLVLEIDGLTPARTPAPTTSVYTYGSPRTGNGSFAQYCNSRVPSIFRVELEGDIVPTLPLPKFFGLYKHVGLKVLIGADESGSVLVQPTSTENFILCGSHQFSITNHGLQAYRASLEACFDDDELEEYLSMESHNYDTITRESLSRTPNNRMKSRFSLQN